MAPHGAHPIQETVMKQTNENAVQDQDVIELGVASIETQGDIGLDEPNGGGFGTGDGISEE